MCAGSNKQGKSPTGFPLKRQIMPRSTRFCTQVQVTTNQPCKVTDAEPHSSAVETASVFILWYRDRGFTKRQYVLHFQLGHFEVYRSFTFKGLWGAWGRGEEGGATLTLRSYGRARGADRFVKETGAEGEGWAVFL